MITHCPEEIKKEPGIWEVFLAGPIQGAPEWQNTLPDIPNVRWISPRRLDYTGFSYEPQVDWETRMMRRANIILFWIPPEIEHIEGRDYAQTTRTEFGETIGRGGKKIFLGVNHSFPGRKYMESKLKQYDPSSKMYGSLKSTVKALLSWINAQKPQTYFTADTHFSQDRALKLSRRPFINISTMDWTMIERWNNIVSPNSTVFHLGDFGETWALNELGGDIIRVKGNYENSDPNLPEFLYYNDFFLCHEPQKAKQRFPQYFGLFGHIHGRQKIKKFGIDVGVDAWNFTPVSLQDIMFYREAIEKGYYDEEVWC